MALRAGGIGTRVLRFSLFNPRDGAYLGAWSGAWRSLVAHLFWVQGVVSSNLAAPTIPALTGTCIFTLSRSFSR